MDIGFRQAVLLASFFHRPCCHHRQLVARVKVPSLRHVVLQAQDVLSI